MNRRALAVGKSNDNDYMQKQTYNKPTLTVAIIEPATMLAMSDGSELGVHEGTAEQMSTQQRGGWGNLWDE